MNDSRGIAIVTPNVRPQEGGMSGLAVPEGGVQDAGGLYQTPWPLSEKYFLVSYSPLTLPMGKTDPTGYGLYVIDVFGNKELLYRDPSISCFVSIPLRPRPAPPVLQDVTDSESNYATCVLSDVTYGVDGVKPEQIRYLRIAEPIGWPYDNTRGGQRYGEDHGFGGPRAEQRNLINWTPVRILGDVPVESDGSAHFRVPVDTALYFQLLDEKHTELRRMRSFISFQQGERRGCVGCHETRSVAPLSSNIGIASRREPSVPVPPPWGDRPVSFLRDVQPVFDTHCIGCHSGRAPAGGMDFSSGLTSHEAAIPGYGYNRAFETILEKGLVSRSAARAQDAAVTKPFAYGSQKSRLIQALRSGPCSQRVKLTDEDWLRLTMWIDANAPYHDSFVNKRAEKPAYDIAADQQLLKSISAVHEKRCAACHKPAEVSRLDWIDLRRPERSAFLAAPLAKDSGGTARCKENVYKDGNDADYQAVRQAVETAVKRAWESPRRDLRALARP
jgi:mono/diheme cytochrome c family protein